jgi:hypothetical protein
MPFATLSMLMLLISFDLRSLASSPKHALALQMHLTLILFSTTTTCSYISKILSALAVTFEKTKNSLILSMSFIKAPLNGEFIILINCGFLFFHSDFDEYNFDHVSNKKQKTKKP